MSKQKDLRTIDPQSTINDLTRLYRNIDKHLKFPLSGLPKSLENYWINEDSKEILLYSRYFRNSAVMETFKALINRFDEFFISVEYFQGLVSLQREINILDKKYTDKFFISILIDSLRSCIDIYSKLVSWYFDIPGKEEMGFNYKNFILPLKEHSEILAIESNSLYKSEAYGVLKNYRDAEKHLGLQKIKIFLEDRKLKNKVTINQNIFDQNNLEKSAYSVFENLLNILVLSEKEFRKHHLGFESKKDKYAEENPDGYIKIISKI